MNARIAAVTAFVGLACGAPTKQVAAPSCPEGKPPEPVAAPAPHWPALIAAKPAKGAPSQLEQFGRLVGVWQCTSEARQPDGSFAASPNKQQWTWFYTLGGRALQDIFEPGAAGPIGTNLRIYVPATDSWEIQWATGAVAYFERITAKAVGADIVMRGEVTQSTKFPPHARKITFFEITDTSFEWKYEATKPGGDSWQTFSKLHCKRASSDPLAPLSAGP